MNAVTDQGIGLTAQHNHYAKVVVDMIEAGQVDEYLRLLFDVIVDRKKLLEQTQGLPAQNSRDELPTDEVIAHVFEAGYTPPAPGIKATLGAPRPAFDQPETPAPTSVIPTDPKQYRRKKPTAPTHNAPDQTILPFTGLIPALTPAQQADTVAHDPLYQITLYGRVYDKREIKGKYVDYEVDNGVVARFKVVGIGPKAVQGLLVFSPKDAGNPTVTYRGRLLQQAWDKMKPVYLPHAAIVHWLA